MSKLKTTLLVLWLTLGFTNSNDSVELIANVVNSLADFFPAHCIYFITISSTTDVFNQRLAKILSLNSEKSIAFSNFSVHQNLLKGNRNEQCQKPLRVIFQLNETTIAKEFEDFDWLYVNYSDNIRSGGWVIFTKSFEDLFVVKFFQKIFLPFDIQMIVACIYNNTVYICKVHLKEVYQVASSSAIRQPYFGNYTLKTGLRSKDYFHRSKGTNLEGLQLRVGYIDENRPFTMMQSTEHDLGGFFGDVWHALEDLMNISTVYTKIHLTRENEESQNSWLQLIKMLQENKIDVGLGDFIPSASRADFLDFSSPLLFSNFQIFYKNSPRSSRFHGYLIPFGSDIWFILVIWTIFISFFLSCFTFMYKRFIRDPEQIVSMPTSIFLIFGGLCGQDLSYSPRFLSCRMLFLFTYTVATIVIPSYSASLTRYLTSRPLELLINDLNDLHQRGSHDIIAVDGSYEYYFLNSNNINGSWRMKNEMFPKSYREALLLTCTNKKTAVFTVTSTMTWELNKAENAYIKEKCDLRKMIQNLGVLAYSIIFPKKSKFRKLVDHHLKNLQKAGIVDRLQQKYWKNNPNLKKKRWEPVSLKNSSAVFQIILFGVISGFLIIILEKIIKN